MGRSAPMGQKGDLYMGRKEGGSLFHQMIHAPDVFTLSHRTDKDGNTMAVRDQTRKNYQNWLHKTAD